MFIEIANGLILTYISVVSCVKLKNIWEEKKITEIITNRLNRNTQLGKKLENVANGIIYAYNATICKRGYECRYYTENEGYDIDDNDFELDPEPVVLSRILDYQYPNYQEYIYKASYKVPESKNTFIYDDNYIYNDNYVEVLNTFITPSKINEYNDDEYENTLPYSYV